jgi:cell division protease FtsH
MNSVLRTILFWMTMILVSVVLWKMTQPARPASSERQLSYTEFLAQVERRNVREATIYLFPNIAEVRGELRDTSTWFRLSIAKESIPEVTKALAEQGVQVNVKEASRGDWPNIVMNLLPILFILGIWIFVFRQMQAAKNKARTSGVIEFRADPASADIYVDDKLVGSSSTPITLSIGLHMVRVESKSFRN